MRFNLLMILNMSLYYKPAKVSMNCRFLNFNINQLSQPGAKSRNSKQQTICKMECLFTDRVLLITDILQLEYRFIKL